MAAVLTRSSILFLVLAAQACAQPSEADVRRDFLGGRPGAVIESIDLTDGDADHVYWRIRFRNPPDTALCHVEVGYRRTGGAWRIFHRDSVQNPVGERGTASRLRASIRSRHGP